MSANHEAAKKEKLTEKFLLPLTFVGIIYCITTTICTHNYHLRLILLFKSIQTVTPTYISALLVTRPSNQLRGKNNLQLPRVNTTFYGTPSFKFLATKS